MSDDKIRILKSEDGERLAAEAGQTSILTPEQMARIAEAAKAGDRSAATTGAARRPVSHEPQFVGEKIIFFCRNGHRLIVAAAHAGKRGRCDKAGCGVPVVIPVPPVVPAGAVEAEPVGPPAESVPAAVEAADEAAESPPEPPVAPPTEDTAGTTAETAWAAADEQVPALEDAPVMDIESPEERAAGEVFDEAVARGEDNLSALLMNRLWIETQRSDAVQVELHLTNGSVIRPTAYDHRWSQGRLGLFAAEAVDGTVTITAVAWEMIQRIVVLKVMGRPTGMFQPPDMVS